MIRATAMLSTFVAAVVAASPVGPDPMTLFPEKTWSDEPLYVKGGKCIDWCSSESSTWRKKCKNTLCQGCSDCETFVEPTELKNDEPDEPDNLTVVVPSPAPTPGAIAANDADAGADDPQPVGSGNSTSGTTPSAAACEKLLTDHGKAILVMPKEGLLYCGNAKVGTTTMTVLMAKKLAQDLAAASASGTRHSSGVSHDVNMPAIDTGTPLWKRSIEAQKTGACCGMDRVLKYVESDLGLGRTLSKKKVDQLGEWIVAGSEMNKWAIEKFCAASPITFTAVRNPWSRIVAAYLDKIAPGENAKSVEEKAIHDIHAFYHKKSGKKAGEPISFSEFVRWVADQPDDKNLDVHWTPQTMRCGVGDGLYSVESHIEDSFSEDVQALIQTLGWDSGLFNEETHVSSVDFCVKKGECASALTSQIGKKSTWRHADSTTIMHKLFASDTEHDLVELVRKRYADDVTKLGYEWQ